MELDYKHWGTLAAFAGPGMPLVHWIEVVVSCGDARKALAREPDYEDARLTSWGQITLDEASRVALLEPDGDGHPETLALVSELFASAAGAIVTLFYTDPYRGG